MSLLSRGADTFYAFRFLRLLTTAWEDTGAFKAGLLDKDGKVLRQPANPDERSVYNIFHKLVFNVKRLVNKVPFGKTTIASYLTALYLIKEHTSMTDAEIQAVLSEATNVEFPALTESAENGLMPGLFSLSRDLLHPATASPIIRRGSLVEVADSVEPCGHILGQPIFEVFHLETKTVIKISPFDIDQ
jgi:hypothetical protein